MATTPSHPPRTATALSVASVSATLLAVLVSDAGAGEVDRSDRNVSTQVLVESVPDGARILRCPASHFPGKGHVVLALGADQLYPHSVLDGSFQFIVPADATSARWGQANAAVGTMRWPAGTGETACREVVINTMILPIAGSVVDPQTRLPVEDVYVEGCGFSSYAPAGRFSGHLVATADCALRVVVHRDGTWLQGPPARVDHRKHELSRITLAAPPTEDLKATTASACQLARRDLAFLGASSLTAGVGLDPRRARLDDTLAIQLALTCPP